MDGEGQRHRTGKFLTFLSWGGKGHPVCPNPFLQSSLVGQISLGGMEVGMVSAEAMSVARLQAAPHSA